ncbi:MAG: hypothetical protein M3Q42_02895 [Pseudomonadota bacterium]|nr:hypothetical protein [Pseudomonadota bacterium]
MTSIHPAERAGLLTDWGRRGLLLALAGGVLLACTRTPESPKAASGPVRPAEAVTQLASDLRRNDLVAYARHALPPDLHARIGNAWRDGRTIWPLTQLPLKNRLHGFLAVLSEPGAEKSLLLAHKRQFSGAQRELRSAASTLGLFATQYVGGADQYSAAERDHYAQLIAALSQWGRSAPLADSAQAQAAIPELVTGARLTGLGAPGAFKARGMEHSLAQLGPFLGRFKKVSQAYGLDFDQALDSVDATLLEQKGGKAKVQMRYVLAGKPVSAVVDVERRRGRWYLTDLLRHAEAQAALSAPAAEAATQVASRQH